MIIWIAALILSAGGAQAEGYYQVTVNGKSCGDLLTNKAPAQPKTPLDYRISDLEGLFFTYLAKIQDFGQTSPSRAQYFVKEMLSMKAEILNDVLSILPYVAASPMDETRRGLLLNSLYQIVDTMGVPGSVYGFEIDNEGQARLPRKKKPAKKRSKTQTAASAPIEPAREAIGFLAGPAPQRDLPDGVHRSIGFGAHKINEEPPPQRKGGAIQRSISEDRPDRLMVLDGETGGMYVLSRSLASATGGKIDGKIYRLIFNEETLAWVVTVENLNNPTGRIGF